MVAPKRRGRWRKRWRDRRVNLQRGLKLVPHLFTFSNLFFGFCSLLLSARGDYQAAAYMVLVGAIFDTLDGRVARLLGAGSELGVQLDSFADALTFCCAPAFLLYTWQLKYLGVLGFAIAFFFLMMGIIRLARFNMIHEHQTLFFIGLPSTMAGCFVSAVVLTYPRASALVSLAPATAWSLAVLVVLLGSLMVSSLRFPTLKQRISGRRWSTKVMALVMLFAIIALMRAGAALLVLFLIYFAYAGLQMLKRRPYV